MNKRGIWLVGTTLDKLTGCKLPSNRQVLGRFFHLHSKENRTIHSSATTTAREINQFWDKARIPTRKECHVIDKIAKLHSAWQNLKKNAATKGDAQRKKEETFVGVLDDLFDIAHADALTLIKITEDRDYLLAQRQKGRRGSMGSIDTTLAKQEERRRIRNTQKRTRQEKEADRSMMEAATVTLSGVLSSTEESDSSGGETEADSFVSAPLSVKRLRLRSRKPIVTQNIAAALDRTKVSDRNAAHILAAAAKSFGHNPSDIVINRESIRQARRRHREDVAKEIQESFAPGTTLTVHWDGKMLPALTSNEKVDRLAVLVSGEGTMKLLGVPRLPGATGEAQAAAVFTLLEEWNISDGVRCMSFDTTASNTGRKAGACVLLEQKLNRDLISLACRHHIHELIVAKVFSVLMEPSSCPDINLFKRFSEYWPSIDRESYESAIIEDSVATKLHTVRDELMFSASSASELSAAR